MIQKIRVITKIGPDLRGEGILSDIHKMLGLKNIEKVTAIKVYRLEGVNESQVKVLAEKLLSESINQSYTINSSTKDAATIEIAYKGGVMNPEVSSILKAASDLGINLLAADSSFEYAFYGPSTLLGVKQLTREDVIKIIQELKLFNPLIEHIAEEEPRTLIIKGSQGKTQIIPIRKCTDEQLLVFSKDKLFLNLEEMKVIQNYFQEIKRDPTDLELETLAQAWSEHCAHKTFQSQLIVDGKSKKPLMHRIKAEALKHKKNIVSAFVDNAGVMDFYDGFAINGKAETHNAPSAIEPYGGAMTGSGGVFRDVVATGQGAKAVVSTDIFCLAPFNFPKRKLPAGTLPPDYILKKVVAAVRDYGNRVGIPTNNGSFHFHEDFRAKPIVLVGSYGILPKERSKRGLPKLGDVAVVIGGKTGRDGIHGATFSSGEMTEKTIQVNATAVQIGNAIEEKRTFDAILEARDQDLIRAVQDLGAGGFSSAIGEMGAEIGVRVYLEKAPLKYQGLAPWEIWVSESQERMLVILAKNNLKKFLEICNKYNVEATNVAEFDGSKRLKVYFESEKVCELEMEFVHHGLPKRVLKAKRNIKYQSATRQLVGRTNIKLQKEPKIEKDWIKRIEGVLSHGNVCSKEPIVRMYDHTVQGTNVLSPFVGVGMSGPTDAAIIKPILGKKYGLVVSHGLNPAYTLMDSYWGSIWSATEAVANYVAVGGDYKEASLINNYIWPYPDESWLWELDKCVDAVCDFMKTLKIPVISGKDSLSATYRSSNGFVLNSPPTLCMSVFGRIPDISKTVSSDFKKIGSTVILVGKQDLETLGEVPRADLKVLPKVLQKIHKAIINGKILACHDISEGGLVTAVFEMCVGGNFGVRLSRNTRPGKNGCILFNETAGCFIVEVGSDQSAKELFDGVPYKILGKTQQKKTIDVDNFFSADLGKLQKVWKKPMKEIFP